MDDGSIVVGTSGGSYYLIGIILRSVSLLTLFSCRPKAAAALGTGFCCLPFVVVVVTHLVRLLLKYPI